MIELELPTLEPKIISYTKLPGKIQGANIQTCPFCDYTGGQDNLYTDKHWVNYCPFCEVVWKWKLIRKKAGL